MIASDQELVDHIVADLKVEPLVLLEDSITMKQEETRVDAPKNLRRMFHPEHGGLSYVHGTRIDVKIPFTGDDWIFRSRTNPFSSNPSQHTEVRENYLRILISLPYDAEREQFKEAYQRKLELIKKCVELSND